MRRRVGFLPFNLSTGDVEVKRLHRRQADNGNPQAANQKLEIFKARQFLALVGIAHEVLFNVVVTQAGYLLAEFLSECILRRVFAGSQRV